jgi:AcrR family transcriptional regulator
MDDDAAEEIMSATYRALCAHGYADLTTQRIADESSKSKAALHYHFDTKEELLDAFLDYVLDGFEAELACEAADPRERLATFLAAVFDRADRDRGDYPVAILEVKAQAPYRPPFRERLVEMDERMRAVVADAVRDGVEAGHFEPADPEAVARFVATAIDGAHTREVALDEDPAATRRLVERYLERTIGYAPESEEGVPA